MENFIRVRRIFGVGLGSLVIVDAKCLANVSELPYVEFDILNTRIKYLATIIGFKSI